MKLLYRLFASSLILVLIVVGAYLALPAALSTLARNQLEQMGFTDVELKFQSIGLYSSVISHLRVSNEAVSVDARDLWLGYQPLALLNAELETVVLEQLQISLGATPTDQRGTALPNPAMLAAILDTSAADLFPAKSLSINELLLYAADGRQIISADGDVQKQAHALAGNFRLRDDKQQNYHLKLNSSPQTGVNFQLSSLPEKAQALLSVNLKNGKRQGQIAGRIILDTGQISALFDMPLAASGVLNADIVYAVESARSAYPFMLKLDASSLMVEGWQLDALTAQIKGDIALTDSPLKLSFDDDAEIQLKALTRHDHSLGELRLRLPRTLSMGLDGTEFEISEEAELIINALQLDGLSIPQARLSEVSISLNADASANNHCAFKALLDMPLLTLDGIHFELASAQLDGICPLFNSMSWQMSAVMKTLVYEDADWYLPLEQCQLSIGNLQQGQRLDLDVAELGGDIRCESSHISGPVSANVRLHALNGVGRAEYAVTDIAPDEARPLLASLFKQWQQPFEIVSGELSVEGVYRWWKTSRGKHKEKLGADIVVREAGGHYQGILFSGLNYEDSIQLLPGLDSYDTSVLGVSNIDIGIPVTEFSTMLHFTESSVGPLPVLTVDSLGLSILQGMISVDPLRMDLNLDDQRMMLNIEQLDLQQIIAMQQLQGLSASGLLDGRVPLTLGAKGLSIADGQVSARAPGGRIQYVPQDAADISNAAVGAELLMKILQDLDYHSLIVDFNYVEDGDMDMQLAIKGMSPQVDNKRPVHFNLNLQQNLLTLLQSLRYVDGINNHIDQDVQDYFNQQKN